jgi:AcrR family transcriptional regulator
VTLSDTGESRLKQERARKTRQDIMLAAASAFERLGYTAARLDDIGRDAQVTKGALYFHFPSKAELAKAVVATHFSRWSEIRDGITAQELDPLTTVVALSFGVARNYRSSVIARAGVRLGNEYRVIDIDLPRPFVGWIAQLGDLLKEAQSENLVRETLDCEAAANAIVASYFGMQEVSARLTDGKDLLRRLRDWWSLVLPAITGDEETAAAVLGQINERGHVRRTRPR